MSLTMPKVPPRPALFQASFLALSLALFPPLASALPPLHDGAKFEPQDGFVLHGAGQDQEAFDRYEEALEGPSVAPFITKEYAGVWDRWPMLWSQGVITWDELDAFYFQPLRDWFGAQTGRMPELSLGYAVYNGTFGDQVIPTGVLDPVIAELAAIVMEFEQPCFVRPGFEPSIDKYTPGAPYIQSYRRIVDIFRREGVDNAAFIWCAGPGGGLQLAKENLWFPGDAYVDWIGIDLFTPESIRPAPGSPLPWADSTWAMLRLADAWKKPVILSETSAVFPGGITDPGPDAAQLYWDEWFEPFFDLVRSEPRVKAFAYINWDWPDHGFPWVDSRIENNRALAGMLSAELSDPMYLHRDTPDKFQRPWLVDLGGKVWTGEGVQVHVENALQGPLGGEIMFVMGTQRIVAPGTAGYLDHSYGTPVPGSDQSWFVDTPNTLLPLDMVGRDGRYSLHFEVHKLTALTDVTFYLQAVVYDTDEGVFVTQPYELHIRP
jgi:hypothetical protein